MFETGQFVVKANTGVCRVTGITTYSLSEEEEEKTYYRLEIPGTGKGTILVPVDLSKSNIRPVMTEEEALCLMERISDIGTVWPDRDRMREQGYKDAIKSNDPEMILGMLKELYRRSREREIIGKKITAVDERYAKIAEGVLFSEISLVLQKEYSEIRDMIIQYI